LPGGFHAGQIEEVTDGRGRRARGQARRALEGYLKGASREMVETMSEQQLREFASTKRRGLPRKRSR